MSKTILAEVDGFTPVIDEVVKATSLMSAVVFGRIWRFCQMPDGVCNASLEKISEDIGIDKASVMRHAKILVDQGYLEDLSPDLRNHPHTYKDTGKAALHMVVSSVAHGNAGVAESKASVAESKLKIDSKIDSIKPITTRGNVFKVYESEIGMLTPFIRDSIGDYLDSLHIPEEWLIESFQIAAENQKRNWKYCQAILKRWSVEGKNALPSKVYPSGPKHPTKGDNSAFFAALEKA